MTQKLLIKFTDSSTNFTNGVELGRILGKAERGEAILTNEGFPIHDENIEVLKRICECFGYAYRFRETMVEGWTDFSAIKLQFSNN